MKARANSANLVPPPRGFSAGPWPAIVFTLLAAAYLVWFAGQSSRRTALLAQLQDPFAIVAGWLGPAGTPLGLLDRAPLLLMALLIAAAAYGLGRWITEWISPDRGPRSNDLDGRTDESDQTQLTPLERFVFSLAVGLNAISTLVLLGGLAGLVAQRWLLWAIVVGLGGWGFWRGYRDHWSRLCSGGCAPRSRLAWVAAAFAAVILLGACLPPWDFDVREYHLQVPKEWLQQGQITFLPHNVYGNMPLAGEMHALLAMALWPGEQGWFYGALAGKVVIALHALLTAAGLVAAGRRLGRDAIGWLAAAAYLGHPWVGHVCVQGLNDGVLACYVFLACYGLWLARRGACSFVLPGLLAGGAAAVKYPGLAFAVAPLALWAMWPGQRVGWKFSAGALILFLVGAAAGGGAWYAKNAVMAGNPVYPLAGSVFPSRSRSSEKNAQWQRAHQVPLGEQGSRYSLAQLAESAARVAGRDDLASPLILPLALVPLAGCLFLRQSKPLPVALLYIAILWIAAVWWLLSHRLDRFLLPAWPFAALLAALRFYWSDNRWWRRVAGAFIIAGLAYSLLAVSSPLVGDNRWFVALNHLRSDEPWPEGTPRRIKPAHQILNRNTPPGRAVLLVGDAEPFDLEMPAFYNTCFDDCLLCDWMLGQSAAQRRGELARRNIAWVYVDWNEIARYRSPGNYGFDPRLDAALLDELVRQGVLGQPQPIVPPTPQRPRPPELYPVPAL